MEGVLSEESGHDRTCFPWSVHRSQEQRNLDPFDRVEHPVLLANYHGSDGSTLGLGWRGRKPADRIFEQPQVDLI